MIINVTAEHIYHGKRENCYDCPVAKALESAFPGKGVAVGFKTCRVGEVLYDLPEAVTQAIRGFDSGKGMLPFTWELACDM